MYYILKNDGTSLFEQPYCLEFCLHCLFHLIDTADPLLQNCRLLHLDVPAACLSSETWNKKRSGLCRESHFTSII